MCACGPRPRARCAAAPHAVQVAGVDGEALRGPRAGGGTGRGALGRLAGEPRAPAVSRGIASASLLAQVPYSRSRCRPSRAVRRPREEAAVAATPSSGSVPCSRRRSRQGAIARSGSAVSSPGAGGWKSEWPTRATGPGWGGRSTPIVRTRDGGPSTRSCPALRSPGSWTEQTVGTGASAIWILRRGRGHPDACPHRCPPHGRLVRDRSGRVGGRSGPPVVPPGRLSARRRGRREGSGPCFSYR